MSDWYCHTHGIKDCECYEADLVKRIAELEAELAAANKGWDTQFPKLEEAVDKLVEEQAKDREAMRAVVEQYGIVYPEHKSGKAAVEALAKRLEE